MWENVHDTVPYVRWPGMPDAGITSSPIRNKALFIYMYVYTSIQETADYILLHEAKKCKNSDMNITYSYWNNCIFCIDWVLKRVNSITVREMQIQVCRNGFHKWQICLIKIHNVVHLSGLDHGTPCSSSGLYKDQSYCSGRRFYPTWKMARISSLNMPLILNNEFI